MLVGFAGNLKFEKMIFVFYIYYLAGYPVSGHAGYSAVYPAKSLAGYPAKSILGTTLECMHFCYGNLY